MSSTTLFLKNDGQSIDVRDLISFDLGFNKLGLVLSDVMNRLSALENNNERAGGAGDKSSRSARSELDGGGGPTGDLARRLSDLEEKVDDIQQKLVEGSPRSRRSASANARENQSNNSNNNENDNDNNNNNNNTHQGEKDDELLRQQLQNVIHDLGEVRGVARRALQRASDADHKADNIGDKLESHIKFAHPATSDSGDGDENHRASTHDEASSPISTTTTAARENNNSSNNVDNETANVPSAGSARSVRANNAPSTNALELAEEQHRLQAALDRLTKQTRENTDALDNLGSQVRSLQRQQQQQQPPSRGGASRDAMMMMNASGSGGGGGGVADGSSAFSKPLLDLSKRVSALEEEVSNQKDGRSVPGSRVHRVVGDGSSSEELQQQSSNQQKLEDALEKIRAHLTTHDVAIEDLHRQSSAFLSNLGSSSGEGGVPRDVLTAAVTSLQNRVKATEDRVKDHDQQLQELAPLKKSAATRDEVRELSKNLDYFSKATQNMHDKINDRLDNLEKQVKHHLAEPRHVDEAEFERLQTDLRRLEKDLMNLASSHEAGGGRDSPSSNKGEGLGEVATKMINGRLESLQDALDDLSSRLNDLDAHVRNDVANELNEGNNNIKQNSSRITALEGMTRRVADEAAHAAHDARTAGEAVDGILKRLSQLGNTQDHINDRLSQIDHSVTTLAAQAVSNRGLGGASSLGTGNAGPSKFEEALRADVDKLKKWQESRDAMADPNSLQKALDADRDTSRSQLVDIKAVIDHIHHTKADSSQVASKADRDYVENALEKLMREVENVINSTNAGLIDTLDKSLGLLRDMIDGKATKQDVAKVRNMIGASELGASGNAGGGGGGSAGSSAGGGGAMGKSGFDASGNNAPVFDGLMGVYSYRCLGCNRTVEGMRSRPMGSTMSNFMARNAPTGGSSGSGTVNSSVGGGGVRATTPRTNTSGGVSLPLIPAPPSSSTVKSNATS